MNPELLKEVLEHPDYKLLKRVPSSLNGIESHASKQFIATIIDLETMGMDATCHEIIEIGMLSFVFTTDDGIIGVHEQYNELGNPGKPIPSEITQITGITNEMVEGKQINWETVLRIVKQSHLIICHNSRFDRNFLELQTTEHIKAVIEKKPFGCTVHDVNWRARGYESSKLEYLNFKMGYFYEGHRAIIDCWATLNLFLHEPDSFDELKINVKRIDKLICAEHAPFDKKDLLKNKKYRWSDGLGNLPKCWWSVVKEEDVTLEFDWLDKEIYGQQGASSKLSGLIINAFNRYSFRSESIK